MILDPAQFFQELVGRIDGPMKFRLLVQPAIAIFFGVRNGLHDLRTGTKPYNWALFTGAMDRRALVRDGWKKISKVFFIAVLLDLVYQYLAIHAFRPVQAVLTAILVAVVPYMLVRGLTNQLLRRHPKGHPKP